MPQVKTMKILEIYKNCDFFWEPNFQINFFLLMSNLSKDTHIGKLNLLHSFCLFYIILASSYAPDWLYMYYISVCLRGGAEVTFPGKIL